MTGFEATKTSRNDAVNTDIVGKDTVNSIDPADVGNNIIENLNALTPFIEAINNFTFYNGTANPNDANGVEGDVYQQTNGGSSITIWRKTTTNWVIQDVLPLGITFQNGIITGLRTQLFLDTLSVNVTSGSWAIGNVIYSKAIPTVINYDAPEVGSDRIDTIYADTNGDILYLAGSPSGSPVKPTLPVDTIEVDSIYVPADGTGSAYLFSAGDGQSIDLSIYVRLNPSSPQIGFISVNDQIRAGSGNTKGFSIGSTLHAYSDGDLAGSDAFIKNENGGDITLDGYWVNLSGALGVKLITSPTTDPSSTPKLLTYGTGGEVMQVDASSISNFRGNFTSLDDLRSNVFTEPLNYGDEAIVNEGIGKSISKYTYTLGNKPWNEIEGNFLGVWSAGSYVVDDIVTVGDYAYKCLTNNSTDPSLLISPNWVKIGFYRGAYSGAGYYDNGEVVLEAGVIYSSNYNLNEAYVSDLTLSYWSLVNTSPYTVYFYGDSLTEGQNSTGDATFPAEFAKRNNVNFLNRGVSGETSTQIKDRFLLDKEAWNRPVVIWAGRNNWTDPTTVKADIAEMVSKLTTDRYLVLGIIKASVPFDQSGIDVLNAEIATIYGNHFVDMQSGMFQIFNPSLTLDVNSHAAGYMAWSLRSDWLHWNNLGNYEIAKLVSTKSSVLFGNENQSFKTVSSNGSFVTGAELPSIPDEGIEIIYSANTGFLNAYDRKTNTPKNISIGSNVGNIVRIAPNGGSIEANPNEFSSGAYRQLVISGNIGSGKGQILAKALSNPTWDETMQQGNSTTKVALINASSNNDFAFTVENNGTTSAHGTYTNIGGSSTGLIARWDKGGVMKGQFNNNGELQLSVDPTTQTSALRLGDLPFENYLASGNGILTSITIPHGLTGVTASSKVIVQPLNAASAGITFATIGTTNIVINYTVAPVSGTNNLNYSILIKR